MTTTPCPQTTARIANPEKHRAVMDILDAAKQREHDAYCEALAALRTCTAYTATSRAQAIATEIANACPSATIEIEVLPTPNGGDNPFAVDVITTTDAPLDVVMSHIPAALQLTARSANPHAVYLNYMSTNPDEIDVGITYCCRFVDAHGEAVSAAQEEAEGT